MSQERTISIIKPDAVAKNVIGEIYSRFEKAGLKINNDILLSLDVASTEFYENNVTWLKSVFIYIKSS